MSWVLLGLSFAALIGGIFTKISNAGGFTMFMVLLLTRVIAPLGFAALAVWVHLNG